MSTTNITVAKYISHQLMMCGKSQIEVANEIGYDNPNVITMFKQGKTKLPIVKVKLLAKALGVDPVFLLKLVMTEYMPDTWDVVSEILGGSIVTEPEENILKVIHEADNGLPVEPITEDEKNELRALSDKWAKRIQASFESAANAKTIK
jgi:transcriptional regulator with XRE-family HTH domain